MAKTTLRAATESEIDRWDELMLANPAGPEMLQSKAWGDFKTAHGWRAERMMFEDAAGQVAVQFLVRRARGLGEVWFAPKGPGVIEPEPFMGFIQNCREVLTKAVFLKLEPPIRAGQVKATQLTRAGLIKTQDANFNSRSTIIVDLSRNEDDQLAELDRKVRYEVRLAMKAGVEVRPVEPTDENCAAMYSLMTAAQARQGFFIRSLDYYQDYWRRFAAAGHGQLFLAYHGGDLLAGAYVVQMGDKAWYKDGGSASVKRELLAPIGLQWEIMKWLRGRSVTAYDLAGAEADPKGAWYGLYVFKSKFNKEMTEYMGTYDLQISAKYRLWRLGEANYLRAHHLITHDFFY